MKRLPDHLVICPLLPLDPCEMRPLLRPLPSLAEPHLQELLATSTTHHKLSVCQLFGVSFPGFYPLVFLGRGMRATLLRGIGVSNAAAYKILTVCEAPVVLHLEYDKIYIGWLFLSISDHDLQKVLNVCCDLYCPRTI